MNRIKKRERKEEKGIGRRGVGAIPQIDSREGEAMDKARS